MNRIWPVIAVLAAAIGIAVLLFGGERSDDASMPEDEPWLDDAEKRPELMAAEAIRQKQAADAEAARKKAAEDAARRARGTKVLFLKGVVVEEATGRGIALATLTSEGAQEACPRLPLRMALMRHGHARQLVGSATEPVSVQTDAEGRFTWMVQDAVTQGQVDVFVEAPGYVATALCKPAPGADVTVRLKKALKLKCTVTDRHGRPVEQAIVSVTPAEETKGDLGHTGFGQTDAQGHTDIDGLLPGDVVVTADHPSYMPVTEGPLDPATRKEVELRLPPAMRFTFQIRSDDASEIKNPTVRWVTDGKPPAEDLLLLPVAASGPPAAPLSEVKSSAVRVPCAHRNVQFELKADGFEALRPPAEPLPAEGGEKNIIAVLVRDTSLASLRLHFQDAEGEVVSFASMKGVPDITRLDTRPPGSLVLETGETLWFPALPAGPYRVTVYSPDYAPVEQDVDVQAREANEVTVTLRPSAKLKVVFRSTEELTVQFRLRRDGRIVPAFPVGATLGEKDASGLQPLVVHGADGATFTGLDTGSVTIDVNDPTLSAEARTVQVTEGETTEVEIDVRKK